MIVLSNRANRAIGQRFKIRCGLAPDHRPPHLPALRAGEQPRRHPRRRRAGRRRRRDRPAHRASTSAPSCCTTTRCAAPRGWPLPPELTPVAVIRRLRLKGGIERVPSLAQALDALPDGMLIAVDVKTPWAVVPLLREVKRRGLAARDAGLVRQRPRRPLRRASHPGWEVAYYKDFADAAQQPSPSSTRRTASAHRLSRSTGARIDAGSSRTPTRLGLRVYSWHKDYELTRREARVRPRRPDHRPPCAGPPGSRRAAPRLSQQQIGQSGR